MTGVVVTGIGVVSPLGFGPERLMGAEAGPPLSPLKELGPGFPHDRGALAPPRSELKRFLVRRKDLKLMNRETLLALVAGVLAWEDAGLGPEIDPEEVGLFMAVAPERGEISDLAAGVAASVRHGRFDPGLFAERGLGLINPLDSLKTLPNMALAHLAIRLGIKGPNMALCGGDDTFTTALGEARWAVSSRRCPVALVGAADSLVTMAGYVQAWRQGRLPVGRVPSEGAGVLVLEAEEHARARGVARSLPLPDAAGALGSPDRVESAVGYMGVALPAVAAAVAVAEEDR